MVDDGLKSVGLENLELSIGDEAADLKDLIIFGVEAGHLLRVSFFSSPLFMWLRRDLRIWQIRGGTYFTIDPDQGIG